MKRVYLTYFQFVLIGLIDDDDHKNISVTDVKEALRRGNIVEWLKAQRPNLDLSLYSEKESREITHAMHELSIGVSARRKFGVEHNGVCLLLAFLTELIQHEEWLVKA